MSGIRVPPGLLAVRDYENRASQFRLIFFIFIYLASCYIVSCIYLYGISLPKGVPFPSVALRAMMACLFASSADRRASA